MRESIHLGPVPPRFDIKSVDTIGRIFHDHIFVHSGDLELESLDETWFQETFFGADESRHQALLIIDGNLKVGALSLGANHTFPSLNRAWGRPC